MSDEILDVNIAEEATNGDNYQQDWTELLENYTYSSPKRGQILEGRIIRHDDEGLLVDVGAKRDAVVPGKELEKLDQKVLDDLSVGKEIHVYVTRTPEGSDDLVVSIEKGLEHENWVRAEEHLQEGDTVVLEVVGENKGGLLVGFGNLQGFVPNSQIPELRRVRDHSRVRELKEEMSGETLPLKVIEVDRERSRLILSAREAESELREKRLKELEPGMVIKGQVVKLVDFGAFVDLGDVDGLVHISELDWRRLNRPAEAVSIGDEVEVKILEVDVERERVSLSRKVLLPNPWESLAQKYQPGEVIDGTVTKVVDFGAFVKLPEGLEGLVHVSQLGYSSSDDPTEAVKQGEDVLVRILDVDPDRERIRLSMRQVPMEKQLAWMVDKEMNQEAAPEEESVEPGADAEITAQATLPEEPVKTEASIETATGEEPDEELETE